MNTNSTPSVSHIWHPITDYEAGEPEALMRVELRELSAIWNEQREELEEKEALKEFNERLRREWAIETGLVERIYTLDRGITQLLIEQGIDASYIPQTSGDQNPERVVNVIRDHEDAIEAIFSFITGEQKLSNSYIRALHSILTRHQHATTARNASGQLVDVALVRGDYKKWPNNPQREDGSVHQYCPPEQVESEMDNLIRLHLQHTGVSPEVEAAWLHHRFTQIHPFQDGNGRVARCLATTVLLKAGWFPLIISDTRDERPRYIRALEFADQGDLSALVSMFAAQQRQAFVHALGISENVLQLRRAEDVILAVHDQLETREQTQRQEWQKAKITARHLQEIGQTRLAHIAELLKRQASEFLPGFQSYVDNEPSDGSRTHYFRWQIIQVARQLNYFANTSEYHAWTRLVLMHPTQAEILISFHGSGREYRGLLTVSACYFQREETDIGVREAVGVTPLSQEVFQINYRESQDQASTRFRDWLEDVLVQGLDHWRRGL